MRTFPAKLLLFGEHALLCGAHALAIPIARYQGSWKQAKQENSHTKKSRESLIDFLEYVQQSNFGDQYHLKQFEFDLQAAWYFDSNIPQGYGMGSSGALVAGFYHKYAKHPISPEETDQFEKLREQMIELESYFHGSSSGIDPMVSYLNQALIVYPDRKIESFEFDPYSPLLSSLFLLDSELPRETGPLVNWFLESMKNEDYSKTVKSHLMPAIWDAIQAFRSNDLSAFSVAFRQISDWQGNGNMRPMVPDSIQSVWTSSNYVLKVCGAGGGGFFLGFSSNTSLLPKKIKDFPLLLLVTRKIR